MKRLLPLVLALLLVVPAAPAAADEAAQAQLNAMQAQIAALQARIARLEAKIARLESRLAGGSSTTADESSSTAPTVPSASGKVPGTRPAHLVGTYALDVEAVKKLALDRASASLRMVAGMGGPEAAARIETALAAMKQQIDVQFAGSAVDLVLHADGRFTAKGNMVREPWDSAGIWGATDASITMFIQKENGVAKSYGQKAVGRVEGNTLHVRLKSVAGVGRAEETMRFVKK